MVHESAHGRGSDGHVEKQTGRGGPAEDLAGDHDRRGRLGLDRCNIGEPRQRPVRPDGIRRLGGPGVIGHVRRIDSTRARREGEIDRVKIVGEGNGTGPGSEGIDPRVDACLLPGGVAPARVLGPAARRRRDGSHRRRRGDGAELDPVGHGGSVALGVPTPAEIASPDKNGALSQPGPWLGRRARSELGNVAPGQHTGVA